MQIPSSITIGDITIHQSENGLYLLTDLWKASGGAKKDQPNRWRLLNSTQEYIKFLGTKTGSVEKSSYFLTIQGKDNQGTYVCRQLVYSYAMWISPAFHDLVIDTFDSLANATTTQELIDLKLKLDNAAQQDFFSPHQQPRDKNTLQVILGCTSFQAEQFNNELICDGLIEVIGKRMITQRILGATPINKMVIGRKGDTLLWDSEALQKYFNEKQTDWTN